MIKRYRITFHPFPITFREKISHNKRSGVVRRPLIHPLSDALLLEIPTTILSLSLRLCSKLYMGVRRSLVAARETGRSSDEGQLPVGHELVTRRGAIKGGLSA